jgi:ABC-type dipeptide/oligopeptide/nickel transport system permease component
MRMTRSTVLEVLREDYVHCVGEGPGGRIVVYKHAGRTRSSP